MRRDLAQLAERTFDLVVVGGGMFGACVAWDAVLRGLSVALIERGDFGGGTSAHSFKMVHGGIRYLQHADLPRIRESSLERRALLRIAPHLVEPLPILIPTYGHGKEGKELLTAGVFLYDLLVSDRNRGLGDPDRRIPPGRLLSRKECLANYPELESPHLTGAVLFYDAQMYNPPRLTLSFVRAAVNKGAVVANYLEATGFLRQASRVTGIRARDVLSGGELEIRGKTVVNAAGPWAEWLLSRELDLRLNPPGAYSRDAYFVLNRPWPRPHALAVQGATRDPDAIVGRKARHLFLVPWRGYTLVGVWHVVYEGHPDEFSVSRDDLERFLREINQAYPPLRASVDEVSLHHSGLVLFGDNKPGARDLSYGKRSRLVDHRKAHGLEGLVTVIGVRATTARRVADQAVRMVFGKLGYRAPTCRTAVTPTYGGEIERVRDFERSGLAARPERVGAEVLSALVRNYGSEYRRVLRYLVEDPDWSATLGGSHVLEAEVVHAAREEMAQKLSDVVFRRTDLGTAGSPGYQAIARCAAIMARERSWSPARTEAEIGQVMRSFPHGEPAPLAPTGF